MASPSHYRRQGRNSYCRGGNPEDACPYKLDGITRRDWLEGWAQAKRKDIDVPADINYEDVLRRYIDHVEMCTGGESYISLLNERDVEFSRDEVEALERLAP